MVTKGKPNARSQSYKAILQIQEKFDKINSTPMTSGRDDFPSPISTPVIPDEGAQRIIDTINVLHHSLARLVTSNDHALMKLMGQNISDLLSLYQNTCDRNIVLQQQLDDSNAKLLAQFEVQNAEILKIEDQLKKSQAIPDFYHAQAIQTGVVPHGRQPAPLNVHLSIFRKLLKLLKYYKYYYLKL